MSPCSPSSPHSTKFCQLYLLNHHESIHFSVTHQTPPPPVIVMAIVLFLPHPDPSTSASPIPTPTPHPLSTAVGAGCQQLTAVLLWSIALSQGRPTLSGKCLKVYNSPCALTDPGTKAHPLPRSPFASLTTLMLFKLQGSPGIRQRADPS